MEDSDCSIYCGGKCCKSFNLSDDVMNDLIDESKRERLLDGHQMVLQ